MKMKPWEVKTQRRNCLKCNRRFNSYGPTNRLCDTCNKENEHVREHKVINTKDVPK